jgi:O-antigen/teichoic acid export membrane protein
VTADYAGQPMTPTTPEPPAGDVLSGPDVARRVVHGGLQRTAGFVLVNLITVLAAVVLLRHLGVANFGRYGTVMALLTIVQGVSDAGLTLTGSRELSLRSTDEERRHLLSHLLGLRILLTGIGVGLAVVLAAAFGYPKVMIEGTAVAGVGIFVLSVQGAMLQPLAVELENRRLALNDVLRQAVLAACFVGLTFAGASLLPFFAAQLVAAVVVLALTPLLLLQRRHLVRPRWTASQLRALTVATLPLAISGVLVVIYFRVLVIMISLIDASAVQVGYYVTSERVIEIFLSLPLMLIGVVLPVVSVSARDDAGRLRYVTLRMTETMAAIGVLLAVAIGTGARTIIVVLGGHRYLGAAEVLQIQCLALITIFVAASWQTTLVGMGRMRAVGISAAIGVTAVAAFGGLLIPPLGAKGAGIAAVAADAVYCVALYVAVRRSGAADAFTVGPFARIAACGLPGLALALLSPLPAIVNSVIATAAFLVLAIALRAIPPELSERALGFAARLHPMFRGGQTTEPSR